MVFGRFSSFVAVGMAVAGGSVRYVAWQKLQRDSSTLASDVKALRSDLVSLSAAASAGFSPDDAAGLRSAHASLSDELKRFGADESSLAERLRMLVSEMKNLRAENGGSASAEEVAGLRSAQVALSSMVSQEVEDLRSSQGGLWEKLRSLSNEVEKQRSEQCTGDASTDELDRIRSDHKSLWDGLQKLPSEIYELSNKLDDEMKSVHKDQSSISKEMNRQYKDMEVRLAALEQFLKSRD